MFFWCSKKSVLDVIEIPFLSYSHQLIYCSLSDDSSYKYQVCHFDTYSNRFLSQLRHKHVSYSPFRRLFLLLYIPNLSKTIYGVASMFCKLVLSPFRKFRWRAMKVFFSSIVEPWNQFQFQFENKIPSSNSISMQQPYCVNDHAENGKSYTQIVNKGFDTDFRHVLFSFRFCVLSQFVFVSDWNSMESLKQYWIEEFRFVSLSFRFARKIYSMQTSVKPRLY